MYTIYTIGHSSRSLKDFINILREYAIETIVDVRRWPTSRYVPHFKREILEKALTASGIGYMWLGKSLGGFRKPSYKEYMKTEEWKRGYAVIKSIAKMKTIAIMCRERLWFKCHRRFIASRLVEDGFQVVHIIDLGKTQKHRLKKIIDDDPLTT